MPRCDNGTRKNKKNGLCEKTALKKGESFVKTRRCENGSRKNKHSGECEKNYSSQKSIFFTEKIKEKFQKMYDCNVMMSKKTIDDWYNKHSEFMDISEDADIPDDKLFFTKLKTLVLSKSLVQSYIIIIEDIDDQFEKSIYNICKGDMKKVAQHMLSNIATELQRKYGRGFLQVDKNKELQFDVKLVVQNRNYRRKKLREKRLKIDSF
jgi:hypothetical protein